MGTTPISAGTSGEAGFFESIAPQISAKAFAALFSEFASEAPSQVAESTSTQSCAVCETRAGVEGSQKSKSESEAGKDDSPPDPAADQCSAVALVLAPVAAISIVTPEPTSESELSDGSALVVAETPAMQLTEVQAAEAPEKTGIPGASNSRVAAEKNAEVGAEFTASAYPEQRTASTSVGKTLIGAEDLASYEPSVLPHEANTEKFLVAEKPALKMHAARDLDVPDKPIRNPFEGKERTDPAIVVPSETTEPAPQTSTTPPIIEASQVVVETASSPAQRKVFREPPSEMVSAQVRPSKDRTNEVAVSDGRPAEIVPFPKTMATSTEFHAQVQVASSAAGDDARSGADSAESSIGHRGTEAKPQISDAAVNTGLEGWGRGAEVQRSVLKLDGRNEMNVHLRSQGSGSVEIRTVVEDRKVDASIVTSGAYTAVASSEEIGVLRERLAGHALTLGTLSFQNGGTAGGNAQERGLQQEVPRNAMPDLRAETTDHNETSSSTGAGIHSGRLNVRA